MNIVETGHDNIEMSMRVSSDIESKETFYTDLNGFQVATGTSYTMDTYLGYLWDDPRWSDEDVDAHS